MRIIGGEFKGRRLMGPPAGEHMIRPTSDRAREAIFNVLVHQGLEFAGSSGLDLYAGTGALGLEAISRGAKKVAWVDRFPTSLEIITQNLEMLGLKPNRQFGLFQGDIMGLLDDPRLLPFQPFRWVFVDPPYADLQSHRALEIIAQKTQTKAAANPEKVPFLEPGAWLVIEVSKRDKREFATLIPGLEYFMARTYGDALVHFWRYLGPGKLPITSKSVETP